ncbi:MAG: hypothetical protein IPG87_15925 [Saprospiraceae bacterium]|nr:hypothetical protein [Candidatus Vicinibacter affinis]
MKTFISLFLVSSLFYTTNPIYRIFQFFDPIAQKSTNDICYNNQERECCSIGLSLINTTPQNPQQKGFSDLKMVRVKGIAGCQILSSDPDEWFQIVNSNEVIYYKGILFQPPSPLPPYIFLAPNRSCHRK